MPCWSIGACAASEASRETVDVRLHSGAHMERTPPRRGHGCEIGTHDVVDVDVVASLQAVTIDRRGLIAQQALSEDGDHAGFPVWVLTGTVDIGVAKGDELQPAHAPVQVAVGLTAELGRAV